MSTIEPVKRRKVGRPPQGGLQNPELLLRSMHAVWMFQQRREDGTKFDSAVDETRSYLKEKFGLKKASASMVKTIIAETMPHDADEQWSVEISKDSVTGVERATLSFIPKKSYPRANGISKNSEN